MRCKLSLKENVEYIKEELSAEEKFFEKAVITEKFVKKYKKSLIAGLSAIVILALANVIYTQMEKNRIDEANAQLSKLQLDANNQAAQKKLKQLSPNLYEIWSYANAIATNNFAKMDEIKNKNLPILKDLATYESAQNKQDINQLQSYASKSNAIYRDLAIVQTAIIYMNQNKIEEAKEQLAQININSPLNEIVKVLNHYGVK